MKVLVPIRVLAPLSKQYPVESGEAWLEFWLPDDLQAVKAACRATARQTQLADPILLKMEQKSASEFPVCAGTPCSYACSY